MGRLFKCPYCGSVKTHWKGYRQMRIPAKSINRKNRAVSVIWQQKIKERDKSAP